MVVRRTLVMVTALVAVLSPGTGGVRAGGEPMTRCHLSADFVLSPGLWVVPTSGSFTSEGTTGTVACDGPVGGEEVGPGRFGAVGRYGTAGPDSCLLGGEGTAVQSFRFPGRGGDVAMENPVVFRWALVGEPGTRGGSAPALITGEFWGRLAWGTFEVRALEGDCVSRPVTRVHFYAEATFVP